jgi:hypothetical protein
MDAKQVFALGLGLGAPWRLVGQRLDTTKLPNDSTSRWRQSEVPCSPARNVNTSAGRTICQLHLAASELLSTTASSPPGCAGRLPHPRREAGSGAVGPPRQPLHPPLRAGRIDPGARDAGARRGTLHRHHRQRLWRIVQHYVAQAVAALDLSTLRAVEAEAKKVIA